MEIQRYSPRPIAGKSDYFSLHYLVPGQSERWEGFGSDEPWQPRNEVFVLLLLNTAPSWKTGTVEIDFDVEVYK